MSPPVMLRSQIHRVADRDAFDALAEERRWGDGFPLVPPTPERVSAMLGGGDPGRGFGAVPPRLVTVTNELIAVNAVMAGCEPRWFPILQTAVRAVLDPRFDLIRIQGTTHPCGLMLLVSGHLADDLEINSRGGLYGPGFKANATIGRALRLISQNVGGAYPQETSLSTQGSPARFSFCFAENEEENPWEPHRVTRGFAMEDTTVTVAGGEAPHNINDHVSTEPRGLLVTIAQTIATMGKNNAYLHEDYLVVLCPEHADLLARHGWSKRDVQEYLFERARIPYKVWSLGGMFGHHPHPNFVQLGEDDTMVPLALSPDDIHIIVAGGPGRQSSWIPTIATAKTVTLRVEPDATTGGA